ncbi:hypothetical protein ACX0HA_09185 [Flavobacterium hauense]
MKKIILLLLLPILLLAGCGNDDEEGPEGLNGKWNLIRITEPMTAQSDDYVKGDITLTFNESQTKVVVKDNRTILPQHVGFETPATGTYDYTIGVWDPVCDSAMTFGKKQYGCMEINGNEMTFSTAAVDGVIFKLTR